MAFSRVLPFSLPPSPFPFLIFLSSSSSCLYYAYIVTGIDISYSEWYWRDDYDQWEAYDAATQADLDRALAASATVCPLVNGYFKVHFFSVLFLFLCVLS